MGKTDGGSNRKLTYVSLVLSVCIGLILGSVIVFLEFKIRNEITSLHVRINSLTDEIISLRHNLLHLNHTVADLGVTDNGYTEQTRSSIQDEYDEYEDEEYDDPNSDDGDEDEDEDDENYADTVPAPANSHKPFNKNETRAKRESILNIPSKEVILNKNKRLNENEDAANHIENIKFDREFYSRRRNKLPITQFLGNEYSKQRLLTSQKDITEMKLNKNFKTEISIQRFKRGGHREDVEVFTTPEFPRNNEKEVIAAHFVADESKCRNVRHGHCDYNDRRYHPRYHIKDWQSSTWMNLLRASTNFDMREGILTVENSGLYFVYAQVFYADAHDTCGFRVFQNSQPILQCTTTTIHNNTKNNHKRNSCFTGSLVYLRARDQLTLNETEENRYTFFEKTKSFFGLFKVGNI